MRKYGYSLCQRFMALLLCAAMLIPSMLTPAYATEATEPAAVVESTAPAQEWALPECDCGSEETKLSMHEASCALRVFLEELCDETAAEIFSKWDKLPEECQAYVLEFLGEDEANEEKLAELNSYVSAAADESQFAADEAVPTEDEAVPTEDEAVPTEDKTVPA